MRGGAVCRYDGDDFSQGLKIYNGWRFSTFDRDNDIIPNNCANNMQGGWWYIGCHDGNCLTKAVPTWKLPGRRDIDVSRMMVKLR